MNEGILDKYQQCKNSDEIREVESKIKDEINSGRSDQEEWDPFDMENDGNINDRGKLKIEQSSDDDSSGESPDEDEERNENDLEEKSRIENGNESSEAEEEDSSDDDLDNFNPY